MRAHRPVAAAFLAAATAALSLSGCTADEKGDSGDGPQIEARLLPPIVDPGPKPRKPKQADVAIEGTVDPVDEGGTVTLQVHDGDAWTDLDSAEQDAEGSVGFTAPNLVDGETQSYRLAVGEHHSDDLDTGVWQDKLEFEDQFNGDSLGSTWHHRLQGYAAESRSCSRPDTSMVDVSGGVAALSVDLDSERSDRCSYDGTKYDYRLNANIGTQGQFSFRYGYAAARMKFHEKRGQHAAFWMQPEHPADGGDPRDAGAEIDVVEWFGHPHHSGLASYVHYRDEDGPQKIGDWITDPDQYGDKWWKKYHVFSVEWSPEGYTFRIDGQVTSVIDEAVSGVPEFLILSNLSSDYELAKLPSESDLPQTSYVDWVRVWNL